MFNGPLSRTTRVSRYQKDKTNLDLLEQETVSGSGISWAICKTAPRSRQITTPAPHHSVFLQAGCPSCRPTNSVKALKGEALKGDYHIMNSKCQIVSCMKQQPEGFMQTESPWSNPSPSVAVIASVSWKHLLMVHRLFLETNCSSGW